jgi:glycosyltransferase involved in cell wall biosynthesis
MHIVVLCKRQYTNKDLVDDRFGRLWEIPVALARQGHTVTGICLSYRARSTRPVEYTAPGKGRVRWLSVNLGRFAIIGFFRYLALARRVIRSEQPDVIWSASDTIYAVLGEHFARRNQCRVVTDLYDNFEYFASYRVPVLRAQFRRAVRESHGVSCVSRALQRHILQEYGRPHHTEVITNAVDTSLFRTLDQRDCRQQLGLPIAGQLVGAAGDISDYRGADTLYRAFAEHERELDGVQLVVAGHRTPDTRIPDATNVIDLGQLNPAEVPLLLNSLDVAVIYNRSSSFGDFCFPQKFFEAVACDVPVVVARVGELSELLQDQPDLFYEDGDVAGCVATIIRQLARRERAAVAVPTWDDQGALLARLLQAVLEGG